MEHINLNFLNKNLEELKTKYKKEGFLIIGIVGSFARGEENSSSDIDILYEIDYEKFLSLYRGFNSFKRLEEIKEELQKYFGKHIDLINKNSLNRVGKKYILKDIVYVK